ncbi:DinB family protein [Pedobacter sp. SD-b]|uniref:DinB family protein n=1 Tax=Pedobacter segetis TaxID=2793069 RepID=A0ABS1BJY8_9SPHI|nr:DinB family protein [Pedobacter segetis]MBK0383200.1 DinB family protein [Pedobacter segetis]
MSVKSDKEALLKSLKFYEEFLKTLNEDVFLTTPPIGGWSYSEVYSHILSANLLSFIALEKCLNKTAEIKTKKPDWRVRLILFLGKFPPGKLKAPKVIADLVKKISTEEARNQMVKIKKRITEMPVGFKNFDSNYKMKHPRLGYLDAKSWLRFMVIHTQHHERQIKRIVKSFS